MNIDEAYGNQTYHSSKQLSRDLQDAGFAGEGWVEIIEAVKDVVEWGWCDDHWSDGFSGGSLATS